MNMDEYSAKRRWQTALREATWVFGLSRLMLVLITLVSIFIIPKYVDIYRHTLTLDPYFRRTSYSLSTLFHSWLRWDAKPYLNISARRSLIYLTFAPYALFFFAGYSESLFVLLCIAVFLLLRRGKPLDWWLAGFCGFLAALTRSAGMFLAIPFLVAYVQRFWTASEHKQHTWRERLNALVPIALLRVFYWSSSQLPLSSPSGVNVHGSTKPF